MLTSVLGVLLAASLGSGPHALESEHTCLMQTPCYRSPVYCLVEERGCEPWRDGDVCFVMDCRETPTRPPNPLVEDSRGLYRAP